MDVLWQIRQARLLVLLWSRATSSNPKPHQDPPAQESASKSHVDQTTEASDSVAQDLMIDNKPHFGYRDSKYENLSFAQMYSQGLLALAPWPQKRELWVNVKEEAFV